MKRSALLLLALLLLVATPALAQQFGGQIVWGDDTDIGIGVRGEFSTDDLLMDSRIAADFNWYFPDSPSGIDVNFFEFDANLLIPLDLVEAPLYAGGGLNLSRTSVDTRFGGDASDTNLGINGVAGVKFDLGDLRGLVELKLTLSDNSQLGLALGALF